MRFCGGKDAGYVDQTKGWVSGRFYPYELGIVTESIIDLPFIGILEVKKGCF